MTRYFNSCSSKSMRPEHHEMPYGVEDDDDDDDFDDEDMDGYDGLSDFDDDDDLSHGRSVNRHNGMSNDDRAILGNEFRRQRSISEGSLNQLEAGDDNRRDHHNQLERKRRASIKTSYNDLREVIPSLRGSKASRAVILQRAVECIEELVKRNRDHNHCVETLRRQNDALDSRVQDLQRYVQRLDGEENAGAAYGNGTLRLLSGPSTVSGATSGSSGLPVYRLMPEDSADRNGGSRASGIRASPHNGLGQGLSVVSSSAPSRVRSSPANQLSTATSTNNPAFAGMNALSAAVSLVASNHTPYSSSSSSVSSSTEPSQSSSQRSSPGCLSSSSSSTASSFNHISVRRREHSEERSLIIDVPAAADLESCDLDGSISTTTLKPKVIHPIQTSPASQPSSPPSILLSVPIRPSIATTSSDSMTRNKVKPQQVHRHVTKVIPADSESAFKPTDQFKQRRLS